jgi:hypothetical protein
MLSHCLTIVCRAAAAIAGLRPKHSADKRKKTEIKRMLLNSAPERAGSKALSAGEYSNDAC